MIKVREKYLEAFEKLKDEENFIIIDGSKSQDEIAEDIWNEVKKYFIQSGKKTDSDGDSF